MRIKLPDGKWDSWKGLPINSDLVQDVLINLEGRQVIWHSKLKGQSDKYTHYKIIDINNDTSYQQEFSFWVLNIEAEDEQKQFTLFKIAFHKIANNSTYTLVFGPETIQSKCELEY